MHSFREWKGLLLMETDKCSMAKRTLSSVCPTGVEDLDLILGGGLPRGSLSILMGEMGSGRSSLSYEFLRHGADAGERGALLSSLPRKLYLDRLPSFDFAGEKPLDGITMAEFSPEDASSEEGYMILIEELVKRVNSGRVKRLVVDSVEQPLAWVQPATASRGLRRLQEALYRKKATAILVCGAVGEDRLQAADCVLSMRMSRLRGGTFRTFEVLRLRGGTQPLGVYALTLGKEGMLLTRMLEGSDV